MDGESGGWLAPAKPSTEWTFLGQASRNQHCSLSFWLNVVSNNRLYDLIQCGHRSPRPEQGEAFGDRHELAAAGEFLHPETLFEQPADSGNEGRAAGEEHAVDRLGWQCGFLQHLIHRGGEPHQVACDPGFRIPRA